MWSITVVVVVDKRGQGEFVRQRGGFIGAAIIHQDVDIHDIGQFPNRSFQCFLGVVSGQNNRDSSSVEHAILKSPGSGGELRIRGPKRIYNVFAESCNTWRSRISKFIRERAARRAAAPLTA